MAKMMKKSAMMKKKKGKDPHAKKGYNATLGKKTKKSKSKKKS